MIYFINEDGNSLLKGKKFFLPDKIKKHLLSTLKNFNGDKTCNGYKRLNNIIKMNGIEYNEMKRLKNFFDNYNGKEDDNEFILNGGTILKSWVNICLNNATKSIKDFKQAKKNAGIKNSFIKSHTKQKKANPTMLKPQIGGNVSNNIYTNNLFKFESVINENNNRFYDYLTEYDVNYVLSEFFNKQSDKQNWGPRINPNMYKKALSEFVKYGYFVNFPVKYIYQWFGIIMKNTAILRANNELSGKETYFPNEEIEYALNEYLDSSKEYKVEGDSLEFFLSKQDFIDFSKFILNDYDYKELLSIIENIKESIHKIGNNKGQYEMFMTQDEIDDYDKKSEELKQKNNYEESIIFFNKKCNRAKISIKNRRLNIKCELYDYLDYLGLFDWMVLPDGSVGNTDYGLEPILKIINEYNDKSTAEDVIVLINKVLDVYHQQGDLSSIFIEGGTNSLYKISNESVVKKIKLNVSNILEAIYMC